MYKRFQLILVDLLESHQSRAGRWFGHFLIGLIILSMLTFILETTALERDLGTFFHVVDITVIVVFTFEYLGRLWISRNKLKFIFSPLGLIDLLVLVSFYSHLHLKFSPESQYLNLNFLRGFRVLRILQVLKVIRYSEVMVAFFRTFRHYRDEVKIFAITLSLVLVLSASGMYYLEGTLNPKFSTIPDAIWWAVVTVSTLGYGDIVPVTVGGRILATIVLFMGLGVIAIMTALVTKVFIDHFFGKRLHHCEYCHYPHHDHDAKFCKNCGAKLDTSKLREAEEEEWGKGDQSSN